MTEDHMFKRTATLLNTTTLLHITEGNAILDKKNNVASCCEMADGNKLGFFAIFNVVNFW